MAKADRRLRVAREFDRIRRQAQRAFDSTPRRRQAEAEAVADAAYDARLTRLRAFRQRVAAVRRVNLAAVFDDATMRRLARAEPRTLDALRKVEGISAHKADDIGQELLGAVNESEGAKPWQRTHE